MDKEEMLALYGSFRSSIVWADVE